MRPMGITYGRGVVGAAAMLLLASATNGRAQGTASWFGPPAASVRVGGVVDYDVPTNADPSSPRHAHAEATNGSGKGKVDAVATLNGKRGFGAFAFVSSPSEFELGPGGGAEAAMLFIANDPENRDRVKVKIEYQAVADTGFAILEGPGHPVEFPAVSSFELTIGRIGNYGWVGTEWGRETVYMPVVGGPVPPILEVSGLHVRNSSDPIVGFTELVIRSHGLELQRTRGRGPLEYGQTFTAEVPTGYVQLMTIAAYAVTNGVAYIDPIVTAHPDNPEVVVTTYGAYDPSPSPVTLDRAELLVVGIDPGPLEAVGLVDPVSGPSPDPSPAPTPPVIAFVAPMPEATAKPGRSVRSQFRVVDDDGVPIADALAKTLVKRCGIKTGVDAATKCARYDKRKDLFQAALKIPKDASLGAHAVVAECLEAGGAVAAEGATAITVVPRGR